MEKENAKVVLPQLQIICGKHRNCCSYDSTCSSLLTVLPSGATSFYGCGC